MRRRAHTRLNTQSLEPSQHDLGIIRSTQADIKLRDFITSNLAGIGDRSLDLIENVIELGVATGGATCRDERLWRSVLGIVRDGAGVAVEGVLGRGLEVAGV